MLSGSAAACARGLPRLIRREGPARRNWMSKARVDKDHAAVVFPGQGAQLVGMGKDVYDAYPEARRVYEEMDEILGERLTKLIFEGPQCKLNATENAQPAIFATSMSMVRALEERFDLRVEDECSYALGHSMGEYTALCAARSMSFGDGVRLLRARGQAMQRAVRDKSVAMVALITGPHGIADLEAAMVDLAKELPSGEIAELASVNSTFQVAISGTTRGVDIASRYFERNHLAVRAVDIPVSVPSHCSLMLAAAEELKEKMESMKFAEPVVPVLSDVTAQPIQSPREIPDLLFKQITSKVRWLDCINYVRSRGIDDFIVYGPSKVLSNLLRREHPMDRIRPVVCASSVEEFVKAALENRERREQRQEHGHGL